MGKNEYLLGRDLARVREAAGLTQSQLAKKIKCSTATLSRIESSEKPTTQEELTSLLSAIGTPLAEELLAFMNQHWDQIDRPAFDHPNRTTLLEANDTLRTLRDLRNDPELKGVLLRQVELYEHELCRLVKFLSSTEHRIAFVGSIGVGKSTGICKLTGLLKEGEERPDKQLVLETGAGGITLCEVHVVEGPGYGLRIIPRTNESIRQDVEDFSNHLMSLTQPNALPELTGDDEDSDPLGISKEMVRAIRNMARLTKKRREEAGKKVSIDPARELALECGDAGELAIQILTRMELPRRNRRDSWHPKEGDQHPMEWLQQLFAEVNNGRHGEFTLPQLIEIIVPNPVMGSSDYPIRIIDTKGIDQTAERQDLESHFDEDRTLVVLCSHFNNAPQVELQSLLKRAKEAGVRNISAKTALLVLPRPTEAIAEKDDDGIPVEDDLEGYELKNEKISLRLSQLGFRDLSVCFFNAREESADEIRRILLDKIVEYRKHFCDQVSYLSQSVVRLVANKENEAVRLAFDEVGRHLSTWLSKNREVGLSEAGVQESLTTAINQTRYASRIRAAVRRKGDWSELDYYHHLSRGVRVLAVTQLGSRISKFKDILSNLCDNEGLLSAREFLQTVSIRVDVAMDDAFRRLQVAGHEAFKQALQNDYDFWKECDERWGKGQGYRLAIRDMTNERIENSYTIAKEHIIASMQEEWRDMLGLLEEMLRSSSSETAANL